jgi:hypothetical protein
MRSFKMKDLMIRIQPETSGNAANAMQDFNEVFLAGHNFGTCTSPSTTCTGAQSCKPTHCPKRPKLKLEGGEFSEDIMELTDLKNMLADMQIKMSSRAAETVAVQ